MGMSISKRGVFWGFIAAIFLALFISPFASQWPDGLERVARDKGFLSRGEGKPLLAEKLPISVGGVLGTLIAFGLGYAIARLLKRKQVK